MNKTPFRYGIIAGWLLCMGCIQASASAGESAEASQQQALQQQAPQQLAALALGSLSVMQLSQNDIDALKSAARGGATHQYPAWPEVVINGVNTGQTLHIMLAGADIRLRPSSLTALSVNLPGQFTDGHDSWTSLEAMQISGRYAPGEQRLYLDLPAEWLPAQFIRSGNLSGYRDVSRGSGALMNYDIFATHIDNDLGNDTQSLAASHELRLFSEAGTLSSSGVTRWRDAGINGDINGNKGDHGKYVRLDTYWRYSDPASMLTYTVGDTISGSLGWSSATRLGGVQIARNFATRPDLITFPLPSFSGSASVPTALEIFVNNLKVGEQALQPGPFNVETAPLLTGLGEVQLVTTDALGRQSVETVPFYVSPQLLRQGLTDYSASAGLPRRRFGTVSADYGDKVMATGVLRYGLSDTLTVESSATVLDDLRVAGAGLVTRLGLLGVSGMSLSYSESQHADSSASQNGGQITASHEFRQRRYALSAQHTQRERGFRDSANYFSDRDLLRSATQLNASLRAGRQGSVNASYLRTRQFDTPDNEFLVLGHTRNLLQRVSLSLSVNQNLRDSDDRTLFASVNMSLDRPGQRNLSASASASHSDSGTRAQLNLRRPVQEFWDIGWNLGYSYDDSNVTRADATWRTPYAQVQGGASRGSRGTDLFASADGSLVYGGGSLFAANRVTDSFAIIDTSGFAGVPVRQSNLLIGHSNRHGRLLVPNLVSFVPNKLAIDIDDLPVNTRIEQPQTEVTPADQVGLVVRFEITRQHSAIVILHDADGTPLPLGTAVRLPDGSRTVVGHDGEVFVQELATQDNTQQNVLTVITTRGDGCRAHVTAPAHSDGLPRIGPLACTFDDSLIDDNLIDSTGTTDTQLTE
ncbi:MAG: fimbria/pilus outer membrane usher protein [Alcanivorax sp.]|nr:fimbria/pilus outer membrane usher protein [Alcanivorax sp.]